MFGLFGYVGYNRCSHVHIESNENSVKYFKHSEHSDKLECWIFKRMEHRCIMCGLTNSSKTHAGERFPDGDVDRENITHYKLILQSGYMLE